MPSLPITAAIILGSITALVGAYVFLFGLPPQLKRDLERKALQTMGENKASYVVKDQLARVPDADQQDVRELKEDLGSVTGGALQNPLGEAGGETADEVTRPFTGR